MFGNKGMDYHIEITEQIGQKKQITPTEEDLLIFYISDKYEFTAYQNRLIDLGFKTIKSNNPYWDKNGITFEDFDGYRTVLQNNAWNLK